ncbi:MAG: vWA domain-containing protein [Pseudomonadota bacterium]
MVSNRKSCWLLCCGVCFLVLLIFIPAELLAKPLLIPGKKTLYQRVITNPNAKMYKTAGDKSSVIGDVVDTFTAYYVYDRQTTSDGEWVLVGSSTNDSVLGWMESSQVCNWDQALTLMFSDRMGRQPVLFFKNISGLTAIADSNDPGAQVKLVADQFANYKKKGLLPPASFPVLASEPVGNSVSKKGFYLIPILETDNTYPGIQFLKVACVNTDISHQTNQSPRKAVVFVVDTTISMGPYIEECKRIITSIFDDIQSQRRQDEFSFGFVAYRSSIKKTPGLEYDAKLISGLRGADQRKELERDIQEIKEAKVSSHAFSEDAYAGIKLALDEIDWDPYNARIIILVTDAGALEPSDKYSSTGMDSPSIKNLAASKGVHIFPLHILSDAGKRTKNHKSAAKQYKDLSKVDSSPDIEDLYIPFDVKGGTDGSVQSLGKGAKNIAEIILNNMDLNEDDLQMKPSNDPVTEAARKAKLAGYAIKLDFLGDQKGQKAPEMKTAWASDLDIVQFAQKSSVKNFEVAVLLTKSQLSALSSQVKIILDNGQRSSIAGSKDFFNGILSAAAKLTRNPSQVSAQPNKTLAQMGVLAEFLEGLPYRSHIMDLTEDDWYGLSTGQQDIEIRRLESKLKEYHSYEQDKDNWESFGAPDSDDHMYRVPLSALP